MTDKTDIEDFGSCVGCGNAIQIGHVLTVWDDEIGHADCNKPFDWKHEHPKNADWPRPVILLGSPAKYEPLERLKEVNAFKVGRWLDALEEAVNFKDYDAFHLLLRDNRASLAART